MSSNRMWCHKRVVGVVGEVAGKGKTSRWFQYINLKLNFIINQGNEINFISVLWKLKGNNEI